MHDRSTWLAIFAALAAVAIPLGAHATPAPARDGTWSTLLAASNSSFAPVVYDSRHDCLVTFGGWRNAGGETSDALFVRAAQGAHAWRRVDVTDARPLARYGHSMIYDAAHDRVVLFGGATAKNGTGLDDVWTWSSADSLHWQRVYPAAGASPGTRYYSATAYDALRHRLLIVGGRSAVGAMEGDTWALTLDDTPTWSRVNESVPTLGVVEASAAYDVLLVAQ